MVKHAQERGLTVMIGCMIGTSLDMAPAFLLGAFSSVVDLDGPLLLTNDRKPDINYADGLMHPPTPEFLG